VLYQLSYVGGTLQFSGRSDSFPRRFTRM